MDRQTQYAKVRVLHLGKETVGYLVDLVGRVATVSIHGELFQFSSYMLRPENGRRYTKRCLRCPGTVYAYNPSDILPAMYCSVRCQYEAFRAVDDEKLLRSIIEYKREYDGQTPTTRFLSRQFGIALVSVRRSLERMAKAERIYFVGEGQSRVIVIPGGRWVYEGEK